MKSNTIIKRGVSISQNSKTGDFTVIGILPEKSKKEDIPTHIGKNALIRSHTVIYAGNMIGDNFQTGHSVLIREFNTIGNNVSIGSHCVIEHHVTVGNNVRIHSKTFIPEYCTIEDNCWIGPGVVFTNAKYPYSRNAKKNLLGPRIKKGAIIGAGCVILPGVVIGKKSLIGAGSVVTKSVKDNAVMLGTPAKFRKNITEIREYQR